MEDNTLDLNFWPSFSDLMLTLVLILVIVVFAVIAAFSIGTDVLKEEERIRLEIEREIKKKQIALIKAIAEQYGVEEEEEPDSGSFVIEIPLESGGSTQILIQNDTKLQRYSFSDRILFEPDRYDLNAKGETTLQIVGNQIKEKLDSISEIQIQGHADPDPPAFVPSNLHLAALRAIEVYTFLQEQIDIDPARHLMSATSFGEYKPVQRSEKDSDYTPEKLKDHNRDRELKARNRRMEILLFYRFEQTTNRRIPRDVH